MSVIFFPHKCRLCPLADISFFYEPILRFLVHLPDAFRPADAARSPALIPDPFFRDLPPSPMGSFH